MIALLLVILVSDTLKLNLAQAKEMALKGNPAYRIEALSYSYNKLGLYENLASNILDPTVSITYSDATFGDWSYSSREDYNFSLSLEQPIFSVGNAASVLQSKFNTSASGASRQEAQNALYYQVEAQYLIVLKVEKLLEMHQKALERAEENLRLVTKRLELGQASRLDLLNAEVYFNRSKLELSTANRDYRLTKRALLNMLGIWQSYELVLEPVTTDDEEFVLPDLDSLIDRSLKKRPKIKAAHEELKEARLGFWGSFLSFLPQLSYKWDWDYSSKEFPDNFSAIRKGVTRSKGWYANASINLFSYPFDVWRMKTVLDQTNLRLLNDRLDVVKEVKEAWFDCLTMSENLGLAHSMFEAAREGNTLAKTQYDVGLIATLDLFQAETDLLDAEAMYVSAQYDYKLVKTKLRYVVGSEL